MGQRQALLQTTFRWLLIPLLDWTTRLGGGWAWRAWDGMTALLARLVIRLARPFLGRRGLRPDLSGLMAIVDLADRAIGVEGKWVEVTSVRAVKSIHHCPLAEPLNRVSPFCTRLGVTMGREAFRALSPDLDVNYTIPRALSQGDDHCQYVIELRSEPIDKGSGMCYY